MPEITDFITSNWYLPSIAVRIFTAASNGFSTTINHAAARLRPFMPAPDLPAPVHIVAKSRRNALMWLIELVDTQSATESMQALEARHVDAGYRLAHRLGSSAPEALESYRGLVLPDQYANRQLLKSGGLMRAAMENAQILVAQGRLRAAPPNDIADARFLPRADRSSHP